MVMYHFCNNLSRISLAVLIALVNCSVLAIRGCSEPLVNWFSAFSNEPLLKVAKLLACYLLKFSLLNLVVCAILTLQA